MNTTEYKNIVIEKTDVALSFKDSMHLMLNFDSSHPPIGTAKLYKKDGWIYADLTVMVPEHNEGYYDSFYPGIGYRKIMCSVMRDDETVIEGVLQTISIFKQENSDPTIKTLGEQIGKLHPSAY